LAPDGGTPAMTTLPSQKPRIALYCLKPATRWKSMTTPMTTAPSPTIAKPARTRPQVMTLTDTAAARVAAITASKPGVIGLKIGVKKGGCAGMEYTMTWAETQDKFDEVVESKGAKVLIDPMAVLYLLGTEMDYTTTKLSSTFVFNNPNQKSACGCGESVNLMPAPKSKLEAV
jgi:iron-sulfur cluster assembly protein